MRRIVVVGAAVAAAVLAGTPALAAPPEISQKSCQADGGTFTRDQGVKTCTVVTSRTDERTMQRVGTDPGTPPFITDQYTATSRVISTVETTTVRSQKGNGAVTTAASNRTLDTVVEPVRCERRLTAEGTVVFSGQVDLAECAQRGLFFV